MFRFLRYDDDDDDDQIDLYYNYIGNDIFNANFYILPSLYASIAEVF